MIRANIVRIVHIALIVLVALGWAVLPRAWLPVYLFIPPLIILNWQLPIDGCVLTLLEEELRGGIDSDSNGFSANVLQQLFGQICTADRYVRFNYYIVIAAWLLGYARLVL